MNTYYETFLRQDIFPNQDDKTDLVCKVYDEDATEKHYIIMVLEDYINGGSKYQAHKRLMRNIVEKYQRIEQCNSYLDKEFKNKIERGC